MLFGWDKWINKYIFLIIFYYDFIGVVNKGFCFMCGYFIGEIIFIVFVVWFSLIERLLDVIFFIINIMKDSVCFEVNKMFC